MEKDEIPSAHRYNEEIMFESIRRTGNNKNVKLLADWKSILVSVDINAHLNSQFKSDIWNLDSCGVKNDYKSINIKLNPSRNNDRCLEYEQECDYQIVLFRAALSGGELDVCEHPTYQTPCPYLRIWNSRGELIAPEPFRLEINKGFDENNSYALREHPITGSPCYELHICALSETMTTLLQPAFDAEKHLSAQRYLNILFSLIGPKIGIYRKDAM